MMRQSLLCFSADANNTMTEDEIYVTIYYKDINFTDAFMEKLHVSDRS